MRLSKYWRQVVGDGRAYTEQDIPTITAYVTTLDMQDQLKAMLYTKDGNLKTCQGFGDEDEDGFMAVKESPYFNQYQKAVTLSLKLAQELGATPLSRARLGVTRATEQSMQADVAHKIRELMRQEGA
jgi:phage terminase small subunit